MNRPIYIVGGGSSLKEFDFSKLKDKDTIVVNKSYSYVPNLDYFITMDYSFLNKIENNLKDFNTTKIFIANLDNDYIDYINRTKNLSYKPISFNYNLKDFDIIIKSYKSEGIGFRWNDFRNGINSGFCGLQLAVLLNYEAVYLLGIDLITTEKTHFHSGYNESIESFQKKLDIYYENFKKALVELRQKRPNIKVYSCSQISRLNSILEYKSI